MHADVLLDHARNTCRRGRGRTDGGLNERGKHVEEHVMCGHIRLVLGWVYEHKLLRERKELAGVVAVHDAVQTRLPKYSAYLRIKGLARISDS